MGYTYFMNNPRMTDKLLEDCGSRRFHVRGEVNNAAQGSNGAKDCYEVEKDWIQSCYKALNAGPKGTDKPAELGTGPYADRENEIEDDLRDSASGGGMSTGTIIAAVIAFIIAVVVARGDPSWHDNFDVSSASNDSVKVNNSTHRT